jgi:hypothetical protein
LKCSVQEGDLFVLDTRAWYHRTELPASGVNSISIARDFFLPFSLTSPRDVKQGEVILDEEDLPDDFGDISASKDASNCALVEVEEDDEEEPRIVLIATKDISQGEELVLCQQEEDEEEENAPEGVDPRAIASQDWENGDIVLCAEEIPEDLPRSLDPNCTLEHSTEGVCVRSICSIATGDVYTLYPDSDGEYEEVEVDLGTGEMKRLDSED